MNLVGEESNQSADMGEAGKRCMLEAAAGGVREPA